MVTDPSPLPSAEAFRAAPDATVLSLAQPMVQTLVNALFSLPSERIPLGRVVELPAPSTQLPRAKPLPKPKEPTKWEQFAKAKGIVKRKRSKLVQDEATGEWKRRHGYGRAAREGEASPIVEHAASEFGRDGRPVAGETDLTLDPFGKRAKDKKQRVERNEKNRLANLKRAAAKGALPATVRLAAGLDSLSSNLSSKSSTSATKNVRRKAMKAELKEASRQVATSTASMGKFDTKVKGEDMRDRVAHVKRKKPAFVADKSGAERSAAARLAERVIRKNADDVQLDVSKAISRFEADARENTHRMKMKGANKKGKLQGGKGSKGGKGGKK